MGPGRWAFEVAEDLGADVLSAGHGGDVGYNDVRDVEAAVQSESATAW